MSGNAGHIDAASGLRYSRICSYLSLVCGRSGLGLSEDIGRWRVAGFFGDFGNAGRNHGKENLQVWGGLG